MAGASLATTRSSISSVIDLTLIQQGHILVTARYQTGELGVDRFSNASVKLNGMIDKMVVDRTDIAPANHSDLADQLMLTARTRLRHAARRCLPAFTRERFRKHCVLSALGRIS